MKTEESSFQEKIIKLKERTIDFSDIPEITELEAHEFYPKNWKPKKQAIYIRIDMDTLEWLKSVGSDGYQQRLNAVLRWAHSQGCPIANI